MRQKTVLILSPVFVLFFVCGTATFVRAERGGMTSGMEGSHSRNRMEMQQTERQRTHMQNAAQAAEEKQEEEQMGGMRERNMGTMQNRHMDNMQEGRTEDMQESGMGRMYDNGTGNMSDNGMDMMQNRRMHQ